MKQSPEFILCEVAGNHILMPIGKQAINLNGMVTLNESGVFIWEKLKQETTVEELLAMIMDKYEVSKETAHADLLKYLKVLRDINGIIE